MSKKMKLSNEEVLLRMCFTNLRDGTLPGASLLRGIWDTWVWRLPPQPLPAGAQEGDERVHALGPCLHILGILHSRHNCSHWRDYSPRRRDYSPRRRDYSPRRGDFSSRRRDHCVVLTLLSCTNFSTIQIHFNNSKESCLLFLLSRTQVWYEECVSSRKIPPLVLHVHCAVPVKHLILMRMAKDGNELCNKLDTKEGFAGGGGPTSPEGK